MNSSPRLQPKEYDRLLKAIEQVYEINHPDDFKNTLLLLSQLVRSDYAAFTEMPASKGLPLLVGHNPILKVMRSHASVRLSPLLYKAFSHHLHQHPILTHFKKTRDGRPYKISDFLNRKQFHQLELYNKYYRHMGVESQIYFFLNVGQETLIVINLNRSKKDFSEQDRLMLSLIRPHLFRAYRNASNTAQYLEEQSLLESAIEQEGRGIIQVGWDGTIQSISAYAKSLLTSYFSLSTQSATRLPLLAQKWLEDLKLLGRQAHHQPLSLKKRGKTLLIQTLLSKKSGPPILLLTEIEDPSTSTQGPAEALGLTKREAEVLHWVAMGRTNQEVGIILAIRAGTIKKHLENIYQKLGVQTRTAAALLYKSPPERQG